MWYIDVVVAAEVAAVGIVAKAPFNDDTLHSRPTFEKIQLAQ